MGVSRLFGAVVIMLAAPVGAHSAEFDGATPFVCAPVEIASCAAGSECSTESAQSINLPQFLRVNASESAITGKRPDGETLSTPIQTRQILDGRLVLQGTQNGLSWTMSIDADKGDMTVVAAGDKVAFMAFGACLRP
jgi:hypothetical protein